MILPRYILERVYLEKETLGSWYNTLGAPGSGKAYALGELICKTMELPWRGNSVSTDPAFASCIPEGVYLFVIQPPRSDRPYEYFRCVHAPGRNWFPDTKMSSILVHPITKVENLLGCIGVGSRFADINADNVPDMLDSKIKLKWMTTNLPPYFELEIRKKAA
jgi:hypothetical protein